MRSCNRSIWGTVLRRTAVALAFAATAALALAEEPVYKQPPKAVLDALKALPTPGISVSPQRDYAILTQSVRYPSINEVAQPMLRLAGIRIDTNTNGMHLAPAYVSLSIRRLSDAAEIKASFPQDGRLGPSPSATWAPPSWSPSSAFTSWWWRNSAASNCRW